MDPAAKMQPRPLKRIFFRNSWRVFPDAAGKHKDAASRRLYLMSFERHGEIYPNDKGADHEADAPAHHSDEFPAGYSLAGCSPALPASASPAGAILPQTLPNSGDIRTEGHHERIALKIETV